MIELMTDSELVYFWLVGEINFLSSDSFCLVEKSNADAEAERGNDAINSTQDLTV